MFSWRARPQVPPGHQAFPNAEAGGFTLFASVLLIALTFESIPVHFVLPRSNPLAAWLLTAASLYAILWVLALLRSAQLRPILLGPETLVLRAGFLWQLEIPLAHIASLDPVTGPAPDRKTPGYLRLVVFNDPQFILRLTTPATATGLYGLRRTISSIGLAVDERKLFAATLISPG